MEPKLRISFYLKRSEVKSDGRCPIMGMIVVGRSKAQFSTRLNVNPALWHSGRVGGRTKEASEINYELDEYIASAHRNYLKLLRRFDKVTATQVKQAVQGMACSVETLMKVFSEHNEEFRERIGISRTSRTWKNYDLAYQKLSDFLKKRYRLSDILFQQLDLEFIKNYDRYLKEEHGLHPNTLPIYINPLRKMIKIAIGKGVIDHDPFVLYKPVRIKSEPRYLSKADFEKLANAPLEDLTLRLVRDMFMLSSFTGLSFCDMYNLTPGNVIVSPDGKVWFEIDRQKSGVRSSIPLIPIAQEILERYRGIERNGKLLPMYSNERMNYYLKQIAKQCEIEAGLSFHVARHTFATQHTLSRGVPMESVSHMMGHSSISSTQMYAEVTSEKIHIEMKACRDRINQSFKMSNLND